MTYLLDNNFSDLNLYLNCRRFFPERLPRLINRFLVPNIRISIILSPFEKSSGWIEPPDLPYKEHCKDSLLLFRGINIRDSQSLDETAEKLVAGVPIDCVTCGCRTASSSTTVVSVATKTVEGRALICYPKSLSCYELLLTCAAEDIVVMGEFYVCQVCLHHYEFDLLRTGV